MILRSLRLQQFRNYEGETLQFDPKMNLIYGKNAQGKSNLLEAISYLSMASSFRGAGEADLIRDRQPYFYLEGDILSEQCGRLRLSAAASRSRQRRFTVNREPRTRLSDMVGVFHTVVFAPEDIYLVKAGPDLRRKYLNRQLAQLSQPYCRDMIDYNRVLRQRNAYLKQCREQGADQTLLAAWNEKLLGLGSRITLARLQAVEELLPIAREIHSRLSGGEELALQYQSQLTKLLAAEENQAEIKTNMLLHLQMAFHAELERLAKPEQLRGVSLVGPHRDELLLLIDGKPAKEFGSQGQQRTLSLSLKLAELELARSRRGEYPVLLLDDVLSELDSTRRRHILDLVQDKAQTFISAVEGPDIFSKGRFFHIHQGKVQKQHDANLGG